MGTGHVVAAKKGELGIAHRWQQVWRCGASYFGGAEVGARQVWVAARGGFGELADGSNYRVERTFF